MQFNYRSIWDHEKVKEANSDVENKKKILNSVVIPSKLNGRASLTSLDLEILSGCALFISEVGNW